MVFITLPSPSLCHCSVYSDCIFKWPFPLDRSKQLLGPCLVCSAYQHALAFDINIGECSSSASLALVFLHSHDTPACAFVSCAHCLNLPTSFLNVSQCLRFATAHGGRCCASLLCCCSARGNLQGCYTTRRKWTQKLTNKKKLPLTTPRLMVWTVVLFKFLF